MKTCTSSSMSSSISWSSLGSTMTFCTVPRSGTGRAGPQWAEGTGEGAPASAPSPPGPDPGGSGQQLCARAEASLMAGRGLRGLAGVEGAPPPDPGGHRSEQALAARAEAAGAVGGALHVGAHESAWQYLDPHILEVSAMSPPLLPIQGLLSPRVENGVRPPLVCYPGHREKAPQDEGGRADLAQPVATPRA